MCEGKSETVKRVRKAIPVLMSSIQENQILFNRNYFSDHSLSQQKQQKLQNFQELRINTLSYEITLHIPIIILASPYITSVTFKSIRNHIIYKTMFIPKNQECEIINLLMK
jgi:Na+-transporting NADH:ubiquinone oxidoreductase subunit NqrB